MYERAQIIEKKDDTKKGSPTLKAQNTNLSPSMSTSVDCILSLQRTIGNQAVQRLFKGVGGRSADGGQIQPKLKIGQPNDIYEQEADRVAEQVMRMPEEQEQEEFQTHPMEGKDVSLHRKPMDEGKEEGLQQQTMQVGIAKTGAETRFFNSNLMIQQKSEKLIQRENGASTSGFQLRSPFLEGTMSGPFTSVHAEVPSLNLDLIERQLDPAAVISALEQIDPSTSVPIENSEQVSSIVTAGPNPESIREGSASDVFGAIAAIQIIESYLEQLRSLVLSQLRGACGNLSTLERIPVIIVGGLIGIGALSGVFANPDTRQWAMNLIGNQAFPVPGVRGLSIEFALDTVGNNFGIGFHLDIGALLPESLGFGESSPTAIGVPPAPADWESRPEEQEDEDIIRPKLKSTASQNTNVELEKGINNLRGGGKPLSENNRNFFESRFGKDFSSVMVHNMGEESTIADGLNAKAFTIGKDIVFGTGQYRLESNAGKKLLAHELTHVVQQTGHTPTVLNTVQCEYATGEESSLDFRKPRPVGGGKKSFA